LAPCRNGADGQRARLTGSRSAGEAAQAILLASKLAKLVVRVKRLVCRCSATVTLCAGRRLNVAQQFSPQRTIRLSHGFFCGYSTRPKSELEYGDEETQMAKNDGQIVIKKYANRRLYNTGTSTYVTLDDLAVMVKKGEDFTVQDAKSGDDITHSVLTQIIFEQESKTGNTLLPISFLRQLISYYGDQMQMVVPSYLEHSMQAFTDQQSQMREQINKAFGETPLTKNLQIPIQMVEEQVRRNTEMFHQAMQMFSPFMSAPQQKESKKAEAKDIDELKEQLRALQTKLDNLG
jgi:polyhydroxyalkanoate synthesis repressor PhaR